MQRLFRYCSTSRTGTFFEAYSLAKRVLDLHRAEREPFLKRGAEQKAAPTIFEAESATSETHKSDALDGP
jgi:hypothetical protein